MTRLLPVLIAVTLVIAFLSVSHLHRTTVAGTVPPVAVTARAGEGLSSTGRITRLASRPRHHHRIPQVWRQLAYCESTNRWHIRNGGYSGGLQFQQSTWASFDVQHYAPTAADATPWQQVQVAKHVQRVQGWGAWPVCSVKVGLR